MDKKRKKVAIMGGTFDPIHTGHLMLGEWAYDQLSLDKVLFMPSGNPPHKTERTGRANSSQRAQMVRLAVEDNPHFEYSDFEMQRTGYSFTYKTLEELNKKEPDTEWHFIIGADSLFSFDTWRNPEEICKNCTLAVAVRDHATSEELERAIQHISEVYGGKVVLLNSLNIDISSSMIRSWVKENKTIRYCVPDKVAQYIEEHKIYKNLGTTSELEK